MLSFEVFPPKTDSNYESVAQAVKKIGALHPDYMSITYGAGGGTSRHTISMAAELKEQYGVSTMAHLTCVSSNREQIKSQLDRLRSAGIEKCPGAPGRYSPGHDCSFYRRLSIRQRADPRDPQLRRLLHRRRLLSGRPYRIFGSEVRHFSSERKSGRRLRFSDNSDVF